MTVFGNIAFISLHMHVLVTSENEFNLANEFKKIYLIFYLKAFKKN